MELLIYFGMIVGFIMLITGWLLKDETFLSLSGILIFITGVGIAFNGFANLNNIFSLSVAGCMWGLGIYIFIRTNLDSFSEILNDIKN